MNERQKCDVNMGNNSGYILNDTKERERKAMENSKNEGKSRNKIKGEEISLMIGFHLLCTGHSEPLPSGSNKNHIILVVLAGVLIFQTANICALY